MPRSPRGIFVTGTDTGVGKTEVACGLVRAFAAAGQRAVGFKPVAAGARRIKGELRNSDVEQLRDAANIALSREAINPYIFAAAVAPHLAAQRAGVRMTLPPIVRAYKRLARLADVVVVEGVGGFLVPFNARDDSADLAQRLALPVLLVVGMRLGCISHALLTAAAIAQRGLRLLGWVANCIDPSMREYRGNVETLRLRLQAPLLGEIAYHAHALQRRSAIDRILRKSGLAQPLLGVRQTRRRRAAAD